MKDTDRARSMLGSIYIIEHFWSRLAATAIVWVPALMTGPMVAWATPISTVRPDSFPLTVVGHNDAVTVSAYSHRPLRPVAITLATSRSHPCPTDLKALVPQMLADLPSYANRTNIRVGTPQRYLILAAQPEFDPLPLTSTPDLPDPAPSADSSAPKQVFFTTLVRRYEGHQITDLQEYHWLFLARNINGWWFAMMRSIIGSYPQTGPPSPPRNSSEGKLAQAIRLWLRDCRARSVGP